MDKYLFFVIINNIMQLGAVINYLLKMSKISKIKNRNTNQRSLILTYLKHCNFHPTAEQIYHQVKKNLPQISLATVYRNLKVLHKQNKVLSLVIDNDKVRYEALIHNHYHFVCQKCGKIIHVKMQELIGIDEELAKRQNLKIDRHSLIFFGWCADCQK